jgi:uncharacterized membrane protein YoaK (UPF0700 family)
MFVSEAHSFRLQARLAISLSWIAGYTNVLTFLICGQVTSHVSGTVSQLGRDVAQGYWRAGGYMAALLVAFLGGAALAGVLTEVGRRRRWGSIYVLPMAVEAVLLGVFALLVDFNAAGDLDGTEAVLWLTLLPSFAMGLQNATVTHISGGRVRTTHLTGVISDLGMETAVWAIHRVRREPRPTTQGAFATGWRLLLLASIIASFALGSGLGAWAFAGFRAWSMAPAVAFLAFIVAIDLWSPIASPRTDEEVGGDLHSSLPAGISVFHIATTNGRFGRKSRMPSLTAWADGLAPSVRVAVLDLGDVETLDPNSVIGLRLAAQRLLAKGRALVLAGVTPARYAKLRDAGVFEDVEPRNVCPDLDLAAAHAMSLLEGAPS